MKKKLFIAAGCVVALMAIVVIALLLLRGKSPEVSDADLQFTRSIVASNENAFFVLEQASEKLFWSKTNAELVEILAWNKWNEPFVDQILADNAEAWDLFRQALQLPYLQVPEIKSFETLDLDHLENWKTLAQLAVLHSIASFSKGNSDDCLIILQDIIQFGHRVQYCEGPITHYTAGAAIKRSGLKTLQQVIARTNVCNLRQKILENKTIWFSNTEALKNSIKVEYSLLTVWLKDLAAGKNTFYTPKAIATPFISKLVFDEEETRSHFTKNARDNIAMLELHYAELQTHSKKSNRSLLARLASGNAVGEFIVESETAASKEVILSAKCRENVITAATQTLLALKCYKLKHGALPSTLDELVPEFLAKVPLDDFDGKPLRYSDEKKVIYSIGEDLVDSNGQDKDASRKSLDISFKIEF